MTSLSFGGNKYLCNSFDIFDNCNIFDQISSCFFHLNGDNIIIFKLFKVFFYFLLLSLK